MPNPSQFDHRVRVVSVENLRAMCERISGMVHCYSVTKVSRSRVHVEYSNPDEYGYARPITAVFPCYPSTFDGLENPSVVLEYLRVTERGDGESWQSFEQLRECVQLWRSPDAHVDTCRHAREAFAPRIDDACYVPVGEHGMGTSCTAGTWQSHGDVIAAGQSRTLDDVEWCERAHGEHCDAPARAAYALCVFTRALYLLGSTGSYDYRESTR